MRYFLPDDWDKPSAPREERDQRWSLRDWLNTLFLAALYLVCAWYCYEIVFAPPSATPACGRDRHWYLGGTPEHIVPVCLSDATVARENAVLDRMYGKR